MSISDAAYGLGRNTIQLEKNTKSLKEVRIKVDQTCGSDLIERL